MNKVPYFRVMHPKDAEEIANSVDPDQSSLIWVCTVCPGLSVRNLRIITVVCWLHTVKDRIFLSHSYENANSNKYALSSTVVSNVLFAGAQQNKLQKVCAYWEDSYQSALPCSLVRVFAVHRKKHFGPWRPMEYPLKTLSRPCRCTGWSKSSVDAPNFVSFIMSPLTLYFIQNSRFYFSLI